MGEPHPVVVGGHVPIEAAFRWRHARNSQFEDPDVDERAGVAKSPKRNQPMNAQ